MKSKKGFITAIAVFILLIAALFAAILYFTGGAGEQAEAPATTDAVDAAVSIDEIIDDAPEAAVNERPDEWYGSYESDGAAEKQVDLVPYADRCPDVYAWIEIPGTDIDYPIAYCEDAVDPFWYSHDMDGNPSDTGMIITDALNGKDFSDPMTLIYGKDAADGTMFSQLAFFRDPGFFADHDYVNIYTGDAELKYRIFACFIDSSDHILVNFDFNDPTGFSEYFGSIGNVRDLSANIREGSVPSVGDHVIALITHCGDDSKRLFVEAVLEGVKY